MGEANVITESRRLMAAFIDDLQRNIDTCFDLNACVVERLTESPEIMIEMFQKCGAKEFEFIRISGFYLGFVFGLVQMVMWMFVRTWWVLPLCGVIVGWLTNVVALKVIFYPLDPTPLLGGRYVAQGLFLQRQWDVAGLYGKTVATKVLSAEVLLEALLSGPRSEAMLQLVDKHVAQCLDDQAGYCKSAILLSVGTDTWIDFRNGVCMGFREGLPRLLAAMQDYAQKTLELEETITSRLRLLPPREFERLLHEVFEQDEIKLILVGAILGALVGFLQAVVQTPEQLGIVL